MAKKLKPYRGNPLALGLQLIGSLIYVWLVFGNGGALLQVSGLWAVWVPLFFGIAVIGSVALFFVSFANFLGLPPAAVVGMPISALTGVSLVALTATSNPPSGFGSVLFYTAVLGFAIALSGGILGVARLTQRFLGDIS